jgi:hypothetical protein
MCSYFSSRRSFSWFLSPTHAANLQQVFLLCCKISRRMWLDFLFLRRFSLISWHHQRNSHKFLSRNCKMNKLLLLVSRMMSCELVGVRVKIPLAKYLVLPAVGNCLTSLWWLLPFVGGMCTWSLGKWWWWSSVSFLKK